MMVFQRINGKDIPVAQTKTISSRRFAASFNLNEVTSQDQDLYRCVTQSELGSGVSNFAYLFVRGKSYFYFWSFDIFFLDCNMTRMEASTLAKHHKSMFEKLKTNSMSC